MNNQSKDDAALIPRRTLPLFIITLLTCLRGALPPVDLRAVCLVRAMVELIDLFSLLLKVIACLRKTAYKNYGEMKIHTHDTHKNALKKPNPNLSR